MDEQKQREIASKGGKAAHLKGTAHQFTSEEARRAGSKGGRAARQKRTAAQQEISSLPQQTNLSIPRQEQKDRREPSVIGNQSKDHFDEEPLHRAS